MVQFLERFSLIFVFFLALASGFGCDNKKENKLAASSGDSRIKTSEDHLITRLSQRPAVEPSKCEEAISQSICVTRSTKSDIDPNCQENEVTENQKQTVLDIYREMPTLLQKAFCQIHRIQLHPQMEQIAYSAMITPAGSASLKQAVFVIGIQANVLASVENNLNFITGKELKAFFAKADDFEKAPPLSPYAHMTSKFSNYQGLYVFAHELSHVIDYQQSISFLSEEDCKHTAQLENLRLCQYSKNRFGHISWGEENFRIKIKKDAPVTIVEAESAENMSDKPLWARNFPLLANICFYNCTASKSSSSIRKTYDELGRSSFLTLYGSTSPAEDFAESLSLALLFKEKKLDAFEIIAITNGKNGPGESGSNAPFIDVFKHMQSPAWSTKMQWINSWLKTQK